MDPRFACDALCISTPCPYSWASNLLEGALGSGKSVLAASLVRQLEIEGHPVLYFFFRQTTAADNSPTAVLRDLLDQLLVFSPSLQLELKQDLNRRGGLNTLSHCDLWRHFRQAMLSVPRIFCVLDALEAMRQFEESSSFLPALVELAHERPERVKILITSRPATHIVQALGTAKSLQIRLEETQNHDIQTFVENRLSQSSLPLESRTMVKDTVLGQANIAFLHAKLAVDAVSQPGVDVATMLRELPRDPNDMYGFLLQQHRTRSGISVDIQLLMMGAVTHITHPLRLTELAALTAFAMGQQPLRKADLKAAKEIVRSACGSLLEIQPNRTVAVAHHTLTGFVTDSTRRTDPRAYPVLEPGPTHNRLAVVCLSYLLSGCVAQAPDADRHGYPSRFVLPFPFAGYAAGNWPAHVRKASLAGEDQTEVNGLLDRLLSPETLSQWVRLLPRDPEWSWAYHPKVTPLHVAAALGLTSYATTLLKHSKMDVDAGKDCGSTPLLYAAKAGFDHVVELLLGAGANPALATKTNGTPLLQAVRQNHLKIVSLLVEAGDDPFREVELFEDAVEGWGSLWVSPATAVCERGQLEVMTALLPGMKTSEQANRLLRVAISNKRLGITKLLLQHPLVQVDAKVKGRTPLFRSCGRGDTQSAMALLDAGADPNVLHEDEEILSYGASSDSSDAHGDESEQGDTALTALAQSSDGRGHEDWGEGAGEAHLNCFKRLLEAEARVDILDRDGNTALYHVQDARIARLLLDAGADPHATSRYGGSILHTRTNKDVFRVFMEYTTDSILERRRESDGKTPLLGALDDGIVPLALELLALGARADVVDNNGDGVFHHAVSHFGSLPDSGYRRPRKKPLRGAEWSETPTMQDFQDLLRRLREAGGDMHARNKHGRTALHVLVAGLDYDDGVDFSPEALGVLLAAGADLEARDSEGQTPLFLLARHLMGYASCPEILLEAGADVHTRDDRGRTLFHAFVESQELDMLDVLAARGADPALVDHQGNTLWHEHAVRMARKLHHLDNPSNPPLSPLARLGLDATLPNHAGRTPLHVLASFSALELDGKRRRRQAEETGCTGLEYLAQQHFRDSGVDQADKDGVTALHLAATHSELGTRSLLWAGADPARATREGLTALHLAARSRQPSVVWWLLDKLRATKSPDVFEAVMNAKDAAGATALHYACVSGEVESVKVLLKAGACVDPDVQDGGGSLWRSCLGFEEEDRHWPPPRYHHDRNWRMPDARAVLLHDTNRGKAAQQSTASPSPRRRLDLLFQLLLAWSPPTIAVIDDAIFKVTQRNMDDTVKCLARIRRAISVQAQGSGYEPRR